MNRLNRRAFLAGSAAVAVAGLAAPGAAEASTTARGVRARIDPAGTWQVTAGEWTFSGTIGTTAGRVRNRSGHDALGAYHETLVDYVLGGTRNGGIRVYGDLPIVIFTDTYVDAAANSVPFPTISGYPALPYKLSHAGCFGGYQFNSVHGAPDSPWLFFGDSGQTFLLSAANHFQQAATAVNADGSIAAGVLGTIGELPAGFTRRTILVVADGIGAAYRTWGHALTTLSGKRRPPSDSGPVLERIGYWTDHGATYYYSYDTSAGYAGTLVAVADQWAASGLPLGYMQLDSWWYPKGPSADWTDKAGGEYLLRADPELFPDGLAAFQEQIGLPLVTHARWIDASSPYRDTYAMSGNISIDPEFWRGVMSYLGESGVTVYEQDWLCESAQPAYDLTSPDAFFDNMADAARARGLSVQYCMPLPRDYLQSTRYANLTTIRVSDDRFSRVRWDSFLYDSQLAAALGVWPWTDVFMSGETANILLATLSAGPVGVGDALGHQNNDNIFQAVRRDGVIVKPDVPIVPVDDTYLAEATGATPAMVAATHVDHPGLRYGYVFAYPRQGTSQAAAYSPSALGIDGPVYVYDYFAGTGAGLAAGGTVTATLTAATYWLVAPVGPSGIAFLGDAGKFVPHGRKRISDIRDDGRLRVTVEFASGESQVTLRGNAPSSPAVTAEAGTAGPVTWDPGTGMFTVSVGPAGSGQAIVTLGGGPIG